MLNVIVVCIVGHTLLMGGRPGWRWARLVPGRLYSVAGLLSGSRTCDSYPIMGTNTPHTSQMFSNLGVDCDQCVLGSARHFIALHVSVVKLWSLLHERCC